MLRNDDLINCIAHGFYTYTYGRARVKEGELWRAIPYRSW